MDHFDADIATAEMLRISRALVPLLLEGDDPQLEILRNQWRTSNLSISSPSAWGFYADISVPQDAPIAAAANQGGGNAEIPVNGEIQPAGCVLYIVDGRLKFLRCTPPSTGRHHRYSDCLLMSSHYNWNQPRLVPNNSFKPRPLRGSAAW